MRPRSLYTAFLAAAQNPSALRPQAITTDQVAERATTAGQTIVDKGTVVAVTEATTVVQYQGGAEIVSRATDEPVFVGQRVFVSRARGGQLVLHGSVR